MNLSDLPKIMIKCLLLTIIIEVIISVIIGIRNKKDILNVILVNVMTNPLVVSLPIYIMMKYGMRYRMYSLIVLEILAFASEGFVYSKVLNYKKINPYVISLILNLGSYFIGEIINRLWWKERDIYEKENNSIIVIVSSVFC